MRGLHHNAALLRPRAHRFLRCLDEPGRADAGAFAEKCSCGGGDDGQHLGLHAIFLLALAALAAAAAMDTPCSDGALVSSKCSARPARASSAFDCGGERSDWLFRRRLPLVRRRTNHAPQRGTRARQIPRPPQTPPATAKLAQCASCADSFSGPSAIYSELCQSFTAE